MVGRTSVGKGSFVSRIEIKSPDLGNLDFSASADAVGSIVLLHFLNGNGHAADTMSIGIYEDFNDFGEHDSEWRLNYLRDGEFQGMWVPRGPNIAFEIQYSDDTSRYTYVYDNDIADDAPGIEIGPFQLQGSGVSDPFTELRMRASGEAHADGLLDYWSILPVGGVVGDFNGNDVLDAADIDLLTLKVHLGDNDMYFDLTDDNLVNDVDRTTWVHELSDTYFGDTDLNGEFDSRDLVQVLSLGYYEDEINMNSTWESGDWNGDGDTTSSDLILALADGGYEQGPRPTAATVPEPSGVLLVVVALIGLTIVLRPRQQAV